MLPTLMRLAEVFTIAGHLAVWTGLYVAGAVVCFAHVAGLPGVAGPGGADWLTLLAAACAGAGVYLFDRVKASDTLLEGADAEAHPERFRFLGRNRPAVRALSATLALAAAVLLFRLHPAAPLLVLGAYLGVWIYAGWKPDRSSGRPRPPRPKDVFVLKNAAVASSICAFAALLAMLSASRANGPNLGDLWARLPSLSWGAAFVFGHVLVDSVLCDLDDTQPDRRFGTVTVPNRLGPRVAWTLALAMNALLLALALLIDPAVRAARTLGLFWAIAMTLTFGALLLHREGRTRDLVDLRLPFVAVLATLVAIAQ